MFARSVSRELIAEAPKKRDAFRIKNDASARLLRLDQ